MAVRKVANLQGAIDRSSHPAKLQLFELGRRICPGQILAERSLYYVLISTIAWACDLSRKRDENVREITNIARLRPCHGLQRITEMVSTRAQSKDGQRCDHRERVPKGLGNTAIDIYLCN